METQTNVVRLNEGFEDMEEAFEGFVEWLYSGDYAGGDHSDMVLEARMVAIANRLMANGLKVKATGFLEALMDGFEVPIQWFNSDKAPKELKILAMVIRIIYKNTHRPYSARENPNNNRSTAQKTTDKINHKNCKARKITAQCAARWLSRSRDYKCFHDAVQEIGEFASDLLMEKICMIWEDDSGLVPIVD